MSDKFFKDSSAIIDDNVKIGDGTKIWHNSHIMSGAVIGADCSIGQNCFVAGVMGKGCKLQNNVNLYKGVELEDYVFCGPSMTFTNDLNPRAKYSKNGKFIKTIVGEGASLGANCTIVCGVKIGRWALVGAGSVVTKDIPDYAIVFGNPARLKGWICECGEKLPKDFKESECKKCGRKYKKTKEKVEEVK